ncbi:MAG: MBOAT family protein, partial [Lachnospiraceae bacterium]|nr:MBOAT family protein [Lachnospiraceae bacterium]
MFILVLIVTTLVNYSIGMQSWKLGEGFSLHEWQKNKRKKYMMQAVALDVAVLVIFKFLAVFVDNTLLPLGISFYIFKMISFQIDMCRGELWTKPKFRHVAIYFTMFPQVTSGPIMRDHEGEFERERSLS